MCFDTVIIDLDDTIVDSSTLYELRQNKMWEECVELVHEISCYPGLQETLSRLSRQGIKIGIVTSSFSNYAEKVLRYHHLPYDCLIAYHDARPHKPHPAPVHACLAKLKSPPDASLGVGDSPDDCDAYRAAGLVSLGAGWSTKLIRDAPWDSVLRKPSDLEGYFIPRRTSD